LEQKKLDLVKKTAADQNKLLVLEDEILKKLSESKGDILENQELIDGLQKSKKMSTDISKRVEQSKITEKGIDETRKKYIPVAKRAAILFFSISDLALIDTMY
jgi:dynein heavy chain